MVDSGGHWKTLAEAQKLTSSMKIPGVFEEDIKRNNPLDRVPVAQGAGTGLKIEWLREKTTTEAAVTEITVGSQLAWSDDVEYEEKELTLKTTYLQRKLDHFVQSIYGTYNNYEARLLLESEKGLKRRLATRFIYGDKDYSDSKQFDGIHALAYEHGAPYTTTALTNDPKNINNGAAGLSLHYLRVLEDAMLLGIDEFWMPFEIVRWLDAAYQEKGFLHTISGATQTQGNMAFLTLGFNDVGKRILFWNGYPLVRTDFLVAEQTATGTGSSGDARALWTSDDKQYSIFAVKKGSGSLDGSNPGLTFVYGGTEGKGDLYKLVRFPELEDYDAGGVRLVNYGGVIMPSSHCLGRIYDIEDAAVTV